MAKTGKGPAASGSGTGKLISNAIKYGPLIIEGVRRYGPTVRDQVMENKDSIGSALAARPRKGEARRNALAHAHSVVDGSAMQCFHQAKEYWVVFSGETPIGVHPYTTVPYGELLRHADLSRRVRPDAAAGRGVAARLAQRVAGAPRTTSPRPYTAPAQQQPRREEPIEGEII